MKLLLLLGIALGSLQLSLPAKNVFICDSKSSKAYHSSKDCRGIRNCTHEVLEISLKEATGTYGRVACKICY